MGFLSDAHRMLFGGGKNTSQSSQSIYGPQGDFLSGSYYPYLTNIFGQYSQNPQDLVSPFNPTQLAGQNMGINTAFGQMYGNTGFTGGGTPMSTGKPGTWGSGIPQNTGFAGGYNSGFTGGGVPQMNGAGGAIGQANQALSQSLDPMSAFNSPIYQNVLQSTLNPFIRNFQQSILPGIRSEAIGVGQPGSSREGIFQGLATQGLMQNMSDISSQFANNAFNQGINQRLSALGLAPSIGQYNYLPSQMLQQIGGQQQAQDQAMRNAPFTFGQYMQALAGNPTVLGSSYATGVNSRGATQGFSDLFGGGGSAMGGMMSMFSDRRLKKNIARIGIRSGLPLYLFEYLWGEWAIGYMADEVKEKYPHAVIRHPSGFDMVNYGAIS